MSPRHSPVIASVVQAGSVAFETPATIEKLGEITRGAFDFDPVGHYSRPDVFHLSVDERKKDPVTFEDLE